MRAWFSQVLIHTIFSQSNILGCKWQDLISGYMAMEQKIGRGVLLFFSSLIRNRLGDTVFRADTMHYATHYSSTHEISYSFFYSLTHWYTHIFSLSLSDVHSLSLSLSHSHTLTFSLLLSLSFKLYQLFTRIIFYTITHTRTLSLIHTRTHFLIHTLTTQSNGHTHILSHISTHSLYHTHILSLSPSNTLPTWLPFSRIWLSTNRHVTSPNESRKPLRS